MARLLRICFITLYVPRFLATSDHSEGSLQIDEDNVDQIVPTDTEVISDGTLAIIAGSDTTSTTLSGLFYHLLSNPLDYQRLQKEIDQAFPHGEGDPFDTLKLSQLPFLNSVMCILLFTAFTQDLTSCFP